MVCAFIPQGVRVHTHTNEVPCELTAAREDIRTPLQSVIGVMETNERANSQDSALARPPAVQTIAPAWACFAWHAIVKSAVACSEQFRLSCALLSPVPVR
jgi:hypothetical protein